MLDVRGRSPKFDGEKDSWKGALWRAREASVVNRAAGCVERIYKWWAGRPSVETICKLWSGF